MDGENRNLEIYQRKRESWFTKPIKNNRIILFDDGEIKKIKIITVTSNLHGEFESMVERIKLIK